MLYNQVALTQTNVAKALGNGTVNGSLLIRALTTNTASVYLGDSAVTTSNGFELPAGECILFENVGSLGSVYFVGASGNKVCYLDLNT